MNDMIRANISCPICGVIQNTKHKPFQTLLKCRCLTCKNDFVIDIVRRVNYDYTVNRAMFVAHQTFKAYQKC